MRISGAITAAKVGRANFGVRCRLRCSVARRLWPTVYGQTVDKRNERDGADRQLVKKFRRDEP